MTNLGEFRYLTTNLYQAGTTRNPVISELPFTGVSFTQQLNTNGNFQGHVLLSGLNSADMNVYNGTIPGQTILWVLYTDTQSSPPVSIPVWSGVIWAREYDSATQTLSISAQEMMSLYTRRRISIDKDFSYNPDNPDGFDPAYIAYQLMKYAEELLHGEIGLTQNIAVTNYATKKLYHGYELKTVAQAIKDLSTQFFDYKIRPYIDFDTGDLVNEFMIGPDNGFLGRKYSASDPNAIVFQFPGNLVAYNFPEDASSAVNRLYGLGYGSNDKKIIATAIDPSKIGVGVITNVSADGSTVTYTCNNLFIEGQEVIINEVQPAQYNGTYIITAVTPTTFQVASTATGAFVRAGRAKSTWPLLEDTVNFTDIGEFALLKDLTLGQLNATSYPPTTVQVILPLYVDPIFPTYSVGDEVRLDIKDDYFPNGISFGADGDPMRIMAINISPGEEGPSRASITLTRQLAAGTVS